MRCRMSENNLPHLFEELKKAVDEYWIYKIAAYEIAKNNAYLCVKIIQQLGYVPRLINNRIEKRIMETDGRSVLDTDFWCDQDMIIAFFEGLDREVFEHACT